MDLSRRGFLAAPSVLLPGCAARRRTIAPSPAGIHLARVEVAPDHRAAGGRIVAREFRSPSELASLPEGLIFHCTRLGARALFQDEELTPIRGQLVFLLPQPEVNYMTIGPGNSYMLPRRDGILLGGSFERGVWNTDVDAATTARILRENGALFGAMRG